MDLYQAAVLRRSTRSYKKTEIPEKILEELENFLAAQDPFLEGVTGYCRIEKTNGKKKPVKGISNVDAPYYLFVYGDAGAEGEMNAGYLAELAALFLTYKGIGSCFQGTAKPAVIPERVQEEKLTWHATLAFGYPVKELSAEEKRRRIRHIAYFKEETGDDMRSLVDAVRQAPSSLNSQPWRLVVYKDRLHIFRRRAGVGIDRHGELVSIGCAVANLVVAADENWLIPTFSVLTGIQEKTFRKNEYLVSVSFRSEV